MTKIWVGQINGEALVFDPVLQLPDCPHVFLWSVKSQDMEKYIPETARMLIKTIDDGDLAQQHIVSYEIWRRTHGETWFDEEKKYYKVRGTVARTNRTQEERHKERLLELNIPYLGTSKASPSRKSRETVCYDCNQNLRAETALECLKCQWILCHCGACGCGR